MTDINKQKFLAELGRLLTFMYEEDLKTAISMYGKLFDDASDEQALIQFLVSPTRQAVFLARKYDAKERKLQVHAQSREYFDDDEAPDFVYAIDQLREEAVEREIISSGVSRDQLSLFAEDSLPEIPAFTPQAAPATVPQPSAAPAAEPAHGAVDDFLSSFTIEGAELSPAADTITGEQVERAAEAAPEVAEPMEDAAAFSDAEESGVARPRVFLLILYILFAIPLGLLAIVVLLVPTLLFLALAGGVICLGAGALGAAFGGFAVFADIMVVLGTAIGVLALGLLLLWTFVWMLGGAIPAVVQGIIRLGRRWCYKEVSAI